MKIYKFYSVRNLAETWRDPDEFEYSDEAYFTSFEKMEKYVLEFLNCRWGKIRENIPKKIKLNKTGNWHFSIIGSWMPTYYVEEIETDKEPDFNNTEKEKQDLQNWAKELKMI